MIGTGESELSIVFRSFQSVGVASYGLLNMFCAHDAI